MIAMKTVKFAQYYQSLSVYGAQCCHLLKGNGDTNIKEKGNKIV